MSTEPVFLRVAKGTLDPVELAALIAVLTARLRASSDEPASATARRAGAHWHRLERHRNFANPRAWTSTAPRTAFPRRPRLPAERTSSSGT